ncbi:hypothetical protein [Flavisolibacter nicotianae]|uniref:hypothetical protein n=1 Tax=Flavisolibacter nicotianae TaxID=2364882 RepID=UPI0013C49B53|nr:hypothetical protein [Flavisolibacter nicotianae]
MKSVVENSNDLLAKFQRVFQELNQPNINKQNVYDLILHNNNVVQLLTNKGFPILNFPSDDYDELKRAIKNLYLFLWASTIKTVSCSNNYSSIQEHYRLLDELNHFTTRRICTFCGLEKLKNPKEKRNEYDHYLDKDHYPFAAINFFNLVPMCDSCNKAPNKGTQNIIINSIDGARRIAYFPYDPVENFTVELSCQNIFSLNEQWIVKTSPENLNEAFETWKSVFRIDYRYSNYLNDEYSFWLTDFISYFNNTVPNDLGDLRLRIDQYYNFRLGCAIQPGDFLEFQFWPYVSALDDDDLSLFLHLLQQRHTVLNN